MFPGQTPGRPQRGQKMEGKRPARILEAVRDGRLMEEMNEEEAVFVVWSRYSGTVDWDSYHVGGNDYRVRTMFSDSGAHFIQLTFKNGFLESWSRH